MVTIAAIFSGNGQMPTVESFLGKLIDKTEKGRIAWRATADSDIFAASIENEFTVMTGKTGRDAYSLQLRDQRGNKLLDISTDKTQAWEQGFEEAVEHFELVRRLFGAARGSALDLNKQLLRAEFLLDQG